MPKPIYVLSGPNLNLLGTREPDIYGSATLEDIRGLCEARASALGQAIVFRQTNHEGELIDWVQEAGRDGAALVLNAAGYGHTSVALHDALRTLAIPVIDCHLSNPAAREDFRHASYVGLDGDRRGLGLWRDELCAGHRGRRAHCRRADEDVGKGRTFMPESKAQPGASGRIDPQMVRLLADILIETGLSEIEVEQQGLRIRVARELAAATHTVYASAPPSRGRRRRPKRQRSQRPKRFCRAARPSPRRWSAPPI